ncbi:amidohydrolase [Sphingomonas solaris]|uniref:Amidohydrolase n=1 Tax=Alterirhizorhabdus solaris TaxID=2529389 RepID=A0A558QTE9_9SPHN|nr:amidohydrolase [Sphingomonas solaris]TVV70411.1 amidohydrolase [Sphingomonas solaris]
MHKPFLALAAVFSALPAFAQTPPDPLAGAVRADMPGLLAIYRDLHAHPELGFQETRSAAILAGEAKKLGFTVTTGVGKTGVVAVLKNGPGPVVLLRADMDALPVTEATGLPYASTVKATAAGGIESGVMHACGHDTHMTAWIGTARRLAAMRDRWSGTLVMIAQPAEEIGSGAEAMLDDGLYTRFPRPTVAIAFHDSAQLPAGTIGYADGYTMANVDSVDVLVKGVGGHGAYPQLAKDPIVLAARIVTTLQTLVSREVDPLESGVVTVGSIHGGSKHNIIPEEARLQITVRSYTPEVRKLLLDGIARIARGEAIAAGLPEDRMPVVTQPPEYTPAARNTQPLTGTLAAAFRQRFGATRVVQTKPQMGGEDFSRYLLADPSIQSLLFWVGGVPQAKWDAAKGDTTKLPSIHSAQWAPDPDVTIATATEAMTLAAMTVMPKR